MLLRIWDQAKIFRGPYVSRNHSIHLILFCRAYLCLMSYTDHSSLKRKEMANDNPIKWRKILPCRSTCQVIFCTCLSALIHVHMYHQIISGKDLTSTLTRGLRLTLSSFWYTWLQGIDWWIIFINQLEYVFPGVVNQ